MRAEHPSCVAVPTPFVLIHLLYLDTDPIQLNLSPALDGASDEDVFRGGDDVFRVVRFGPVTVIVMVSGDDFLC